MGGPACSRYRYPLVDGLLGGLLEEGIADVGDGYRYTVPVTCCSASSHDS
jgi:hypothetical protein